MWGGHETGWARALNCPVTLEINRATKVSLTLLPTLRAPSVISALCTMSDPPAAFLTSPTRSVAAGVDPSGPRARINP